MIGKKDKVTKKNPQWKKFLMIALWSVIIMFASSLLYTLLCKWLMPPITITQMSDMVAGYGMKRDYVNWEHISRNIKLAALASEDQRFAEHGGFDWKSIDKSMNDTHDRRKKKRPKGAGASTISQQTAKNVFLWQGSGVTRYIRKVPEFYFTQMIEWTWGKKRILEVYLNVIEMGPGIYGVEAASRAYFNKHAKDLSRSEAAMIIACLPNPKKFTVRPMSRRVQWRYTQIMEQMDNLDGDEDIEAVLK